MGSIAIAALAVGTAVSVAGTAYAMKSQSDATAAAKGAANANSRLGRARAAAEAAVSRYQAQLSYASAMAEADINDMNATVLRDTAGAEANEGFQNMIRMKAADLRANSRTEAAYGASGIQADTGSPEVAAAYNAGFQQLARLDQAYSTTRKMAGLEWDATMQNYQAEVTREMAKQYEYAEAMADWSEATSITGIGVQRDSAISIANAQMGQAIGNGLQSLSSTLVNVAGPLGEIDLDFGGGDKAGGIKAGGIT